MSAVLDRDARARHTGPLVMDTLRDQLIAWARQAVPHECCGLLLGIDNGPGKIAAIRRADLLTNIAADPRRMFAFDNAEMARTARLHRGELDVVGFFHSHPSSPPAPSRNDIENASAWPGYLQIIIGQSGSGFDVRCFLVGDKGWNELEQRSETNG